MEALNWLMYFMSTGKKLNEMFSRQSSTFVEPDEVHGKKRWQIVQLIPEPDKPSMETRPSTRPSGSKQQSSLEMELLSEKDLNDSSDGQPLQSQPNQPSPLQDQSMEIEYKKGMYMGDTATLKDLRNQFIDSGQVDKENLFFQFLRSDMLGDYIPIDEEEETKLTNLHPYLVQPQTLYVERLEGGKRALFSFPGMFQSEHSCMRVTYPIPYIHCIYLTIVIHNTGHACISYIQKYLIANCVLYHSIHRYRLWAFSGHDDHKHFVSKHCHSPEGS